MVRDTVAFLRSAGRRVFIDCEHFFDGYRFDPDYTARRSLDTARTRARTSPFCATPTAACCRSVIARAVREVSARSGVHLGTTPEDVVRRLGIHCQDDTGCAVANTVAAVRGGRDTRPVHGQRLRRAGRQRGPVRHRRQPRRLKLGLPVLPHGAWNELTRISHAVAEIAQLAPDTHQAYVGAAAFAHKAGLHASAIKVEPVLYNHIDPTTVGNWIWARSW